MLTSDILGTSLHFRTKVILYPTEVKLNRYPRPYKRTILFQGYKVRVANLRFAKCLKILLILILIKLDVSIALVVAKDAFSKKRILFTNTLDF